MAGAVAAAFVSSRRWAFPVFGVLLLACISEAAYTAPNSETYYSKTCPQATTLVKNLVDKFVTADRNLAGGLQRLHFHDCFVRGCDASVLLQSSSETAERDALVNTALRGFEQIDEIKEALESACPGIVSCADVLALVARDATVKVGGPSWPVALGRLDGFVSVEQEAIDHLPSPLFNYSQLVQNFAAVGLTEQEMVTLSGAHTIGRSRCGPVQNRLYNFSGVAGASDPTLDRTLTKKLQRQCPENDLTSIIAMDPTKNNFDNLYYKAVAASKGVFSSDAALITSPVGRELVTKYSQSGSCFFDDFAAAMVRMGNIRWSTGSSGQIRRKCSAVN